MTVGTVVGKASLVLIAWLAGTATGVGLYLHDATSVVGALLLFGVVFGYFGWGFTVMTIFDIYGDASTFRISVVVSSVLLVAAIGLAVMVHALGPAYHTRYGERADAFITELTEDTRGVHCRISLSATEQDLGWLDGQSHNSDGCVGRVAGNRIQVSVDPRGWVTPVSVNRLGSELPLRIALATFMTVIVVFVIALIATAVITRPRRLGGGALDR